MDVLFKKASTAGPEKPAESKKNFLESSDDEDVKVSAAATATAPTKSGIEGQLPAVASAATSSGATDKVVDIKKLEFLSKTSVIEPEAATSAVTPAVTPAVTSDAPVVQESGEIVSDDDDEADGNGFSVKKFKDALSTKLSKGPKIFGGKGSASAKPGPENPAMSKPGADFLSLHFGR
jgi:hypothetical protein